ncbi:MAG: efflux RND transporter periplasmic adaptor subunit [Christensenellales bacterium]|jgi:multidrug efflux pump subunit AcrA (membrane-fusion protein)
MKQRIMRIAAAAALACLLSGCALVGGGVYEPQLMEGTVARGPLALQILSQGSVSAQELISVKSEHKFVFPGYLVSEGQMVEPDTVLCEIPAEEIADRLEEVRDKIVAKKLEIATTGSSRTYYSYKAPVSGRVKSIQVKKGDDVAEVMEQIGYIALISTESRMNVRVSPAGSLAKDAEIVVTVGRKKYDGQVTSVDASGAVVSIATDMPAVGAEAVITDKSGAELGRGPLELASFVTVDAVMGEVNSVPAKENAQVEIGATVVVASKLSGELITKFEELAALEKEEQELAALEGGAPIVAGVTGIVMELPLQPGTEVLEGAPVASIARPEAMLVKTQVDELDVASVYIGQPARVQVAALGDMSYPGTVSYISNKATVDEHNYTGTPTFTVHITLDSSEGLSMGMSVLAYLIIMEQDDVLQVPVGALTTMEDGSMAVRVIDEGAEMEKGAINPPYTLVPVTVGMKNQSSAEILSGLTEGQRILFDPWKSDMPFFPRPDIIEKQRIAEAADDSVVIPEPEH